jgi:hypothetical protein
MTADEKREAIKQLENAYLNRIDFLTKEYRTKVRELMKTIEKRKLERLRKELTSQLR